MELALGSILTSHGKFSQAELLLQDSLTRRTALSATDSTNSNTDTYKLQSMNNLSILYRKQGKYDVSEKLFLQCLDGCLKNPNLGEKHAETLAVLINLSDVYFLTENYEAAEENYNKAYQGVYMCMFMNV